MRRKGASLSAESASRESREDAKRGLVIQKNNSSNTLERKLSQQLIIMIFTPPILPPYNSFALGGYVTLTNPLSPHLLQATRFPTNPLLGPWTLRAMWAPGVSTCSRPSPTTTMDLLSLTTAMTEVLPKFHAHVGLNSDPGHTEVLPKFRDYVGLNLALPLTEVLPKFPNHVGLSPATWHTEVLPKFRNHMGLNPITLRSATKVLRSRGTQSCKGPYGSAAKILRLRGTQSCHASDGSAAKISESRGTQSGNGTYGSAAKILLLRGTQSRHYPNKSAAKISESCGTQSDTGIYGSAAKILILRGTQSPHDSDGNATEHHLKK